MSNLTLGNVVLQMACFLFCLVIGMFIVSLILERLTFYIPRLTVLVREGAVYKRSVVITVAEVLGWSAVVVGVYLFWYYNFPYVFQQVTTEPVALAAWAVVFFYLLSRFALFGRTIKREFYYSAYMHYITPQALHDYQVFSEQLDDMDNAELEEQAAIIKTLPYMHQQAVERKMGERGLWEIWVGNHRKIGLLSMLGPGKKMEV